MYTVVALANLINFDQISFKEKSDLCYVWLVQSVQVARSACATVLTLPPWHSQATVNVCIAHLYPVRVAVEVLQCVPQLATQATGTRDVTIVQGFKHLHRAVFLRLIIALTSCYIRTAKNWLVEE